MSYGDPSKMPLGHRTALVQELRRAERRRDDLTIIIRHLTDRLAEKPPGKQSVGEPG
jgi:hypothetical protein